MRQFLEQLNASIPVGSLVTVGLALVLVAVVGFGLGRIGRGRLVRARVRVEEELARQRRKPKHKAQPVQDTSSMANLARTLPHVVRDLNRNDLSPNDVPGLILKMANAIFEPKQILLYLIRTSGKERVLSLRGASGLDPVPEPLKTVRMGRGKVGWVAAHELDMLQGDWNTLNRTERQNVPDNHVMLKADIVGPLVHYAKNRQHVLGVLCIGDPKVRPKDPKLMFQMVTNLGSMALVNARNLNKLRAAAHTDGLTGLINKRKFLGDLAPGLLVECDKRAKPFSVFIFDIDHFKNYNDTNGHPAGDELLRALGSMITQSLRPGDFACRYGGEEFVIAMPETDKEVALEVAELLRRRIADEPFMHREEQPSGLVSISGGIASSPKDGASMSELIQRADEVLYKSKKGGRNRVAVYKGISIGDTDEGPAAIDAAADPSTPGQPTQR